MTSLAYRTSVTTDKSFVNFSASTNGLLFVIWNEQQVLVFNKEARLVNQIKPEGKLRHLSITSRGDFICLVMENGYTVVNVQGMILHQEHWPSPSRSFRSSLFSLETQWFLVVGEKGLQQFDFSTGALLSSIPDIPLQASDIVLAHHPEEKIVAIWSSSGPGTLMTHWCVCDRRSLHIFDSPMVHNCGIPSFHPSGAEFMVLTESDELHRRIFPHAQIIQSLNSESILQGTSDFAFESLGDSVCYISDKTGLVNTSEGALFLLEFASENNFTELPMLGNDLDQSESLPVFNLFVSYSANLLFAYSPIGSKSLFSLWDITSISGPLLSHSSSHLYTTKLLTEGRILLSSS